MKIWRWIKNTGVQNYQFLKKYLGPDKNYVKWTLRNLSILVILFITFKVIDTNFKYKFWLNEKKVIEWDVRSYYSYLPAAFIYGDLTLDFVDQNKKAIEQLWPVKTEDGKYLIVTSCGLSILYSPFFLIAHAYAHISPFEADGYSVPYKFALVFSALFYLIIGLIFLRKTLKKFFKRDFLVAFVILAIALGTNLFYYSTHEAAMSHVFNFSLISVFVYLTIKWHEKPYWLNTIWIGLLFGLITLVRPTNVLILIVFMFWGITSWKSLWKRTLFFIRRFDLLLIMIFAFLIAWFPQFLYWKTVTGHWLYYSYGAKDASFFFLNPQISDILISYRKGWFIYTPIMAIAFIGIFFLIKRLKIAFWGILIYISAMIYVLSSWWSWWYGGGFGLRAFIDSYAVMAIPLTAILDVSLKKKWIAIFSFLIVAVLIWFNTFQIRQYKNTAIHWWWMNKNTYWETFLKLKPTGKYWDMVTLPDYEKARKGNYVEITPEEKRNREQTRQLKKEFGSFIRKDLTIITNLKKRSNSDTELDSLINIYIEENLNTYVLTTRKKILDSIASRIRNSSKLLEKAIKDAEKRNISVDSMLKLNAIYIYRHQ